MQKIKRSYGMTTKTLHKHSWFRDTDFHTINTEKPFPDKCLNLKKRLGGIQAVSGEVFLVIDAAGQKYKLHRCKNTARARRIAMIVNLLQKVFPALIGRDRCYILFSFVNGRTLEKRRTIKECFEMGKLCSYVSAIQIKGNFHFSFQRKLNDLASNKLLAPAEKKSLQQIYFQLKKQVKLCSVLELWDSGLPNFMVSEGKIFFVDEGGAEISIRGSCLLSMIEKLNSKQFKSFSQGYGGRKAMTFFTSEYELLLRLFYFVGIIFARMKRGDKRINKYLKPLKYFARKGKPPIRFLMKR